MTNKMKRLTALMLALVMIYSCLPMNVLAEATSGVAGGYSIQRSVSYPTLQNGTVVEVEKEAPKGKAITSPMVGTFYAAPSPDSESFVEVGKSISTGDVVCIVEAMKLMNEIKSEFSGKVTQICVKNGDPVEFGQVLMYVE